MKNIQVIDGATNCTYPIYAMKDKDFALIFPGEGQDIEFIQDVFQRLGKRKTQLVMKRVWQSRMDKKSIIGIHGTLFYELEANRKYYPTKKESDLDSRKFIS